MCQNKLKNSIFNYRESLEQIVDGSSPSAGDHFKMLVNKDKHINL